MKKSMIISFVVLLFGMTGSVIAQAKTSDANERKAVLAAVQEFFDRMAANDIAGFERVLIPEGRFFSFRVIDGKEVMRSRSNQESASGLQGNKQILRERMWDPEVRIHGSIANVWTPYDFWIDGKLSHCGVDSFDMVKVDGKWKIAGGIYTVETNCKPSPLGPLKE